MMPRFLFVLGIVLGSVSALAGEFEDLEELLARASATDQLAPDERNPVIRSDVYQAQRELQRRYAAADATVRSMFAARLEQALSDPGPAVRTAAARAIAVRPAWDDVGPILQAARVERSDSVQGALVRSLTRAITMLPTPEQAAQTPAAIQLIDALIRFEDTHPESRSALVVSLGRLGPSALPAIRDFAQDPRWEPILHSHLPAAFAATGAQDAALDIMALYTADVSTGFRVACIDAMGATLRSAGEEIGPVRDSLIILLRSLILDGTDSTLSAAAAWAYCRWPLAAQDAEVVATVQERLLVSWADARKAYLRSLAVLGVAPNPQTQAQLELIATSDLESASHRKIASTILLNFVNIED